MCLESWVKMTDNLIERNFISKEIENLGESVTVRVVTKVSFSKHGDVTETTSDTTSVKCFVNVMTQEDQEVKEGIFKAGDLRFWFKGDQTISVGDRIQYNSIWYAIDDLIPSFHVGTTIVKEARTSKV